jgi:hypothetical protein
VSKQQFDNTNSGFIGKNTRKETENHPDITGHINVEGREYWLSGWQNSKGYGLRLKPKDSASNKAVAAKSKDAVEQAFDEDSSIPF